MNNKLLISIFRLLNNHKKQMAITLLLACITVLFSIALMSLSSYVLSYASLLPSIAELALAITFVRFLGLGRGVFRYIERLETHNTIFIALSNLRVQLYQKYRTLKGETLQTLNKIDAFQQLTIDINTYQDAILRGALPSFLTLIIGMIAFFILLLVQPVMALIFAVFYTIFAYSSFFVYKVGNTNQTLLHSLELKQLQIDFSDYMTHKALFKWQSIETHKMAQILKQITIVEASLNAFSIRQSLAKLIQQLGINVHFLSMLIFTSYLVSQNRLDGLYLGSLTLVIFNVYESALLLGDAPDKMRNGSESAKRLFSDIRSYTVPSSGNVSIGKDINGEAIYTFKEISFNYPNTAFQLTIPFFELVQGKHIAFVGSNGSGKSTFANIISGFYEIDEHASVLRDAFSVVTQDIYLFNDSLVANLRVGKSEASQEEIQSALHMVALDPDHWIKSQTSIGEDGQQISLGQKRRIGIARALLKSSPFLLLDEPYNGLDQKTAQDIQRRFLFQTEPSIVCITHHLIEMQKYDTIYVFDQGKIIASGTHDQLMVSSNIYQRLYNVNESSNNTKLYIKKEP